MKNWIKYKVISDFQVVLAVALGFLLFSQFAQAATVTVRVVVEFVDVVAIKAAAIPEDVILLDSESQGKTITVEDDGTITVAYQ